jgi:hypothetical protein
MDRSVNEYYPDSWVVLKLQNEGETLYKVLGGWSGGYLDGDSWRMNSGIVRVEEKSKHWEFFGSSGSVYKCYRKGYRLTMATSGIYNELKEKFVDKVEMMPEDTNWMEIEW